MLVLFVHHGTQLLRRSAHIKAVMQWSNHLLRRSLWGQDEVHTLRMAINSNIGAGSCCGIGPATRERGKHLKVRRYEFNQDMWRGMTTIAGSVCFSIAPGGFDDQQLQTPSTKLRAF